MPPKEIHFNETMTKCWILNPINGEMEELHHVENVDLTSEDLLYDDVIPKSFDWYFCTSFRILLTNNERKLHGRPLRRGIINKKFKKCNFYVVKGENND